MNPREDAHSTKYSPPKLRAYGSIQEITSAVQFTGQPDGGYYDAIEDGEIGEDEGIASPF